MTYFYYQCVFTIVGAAIGFSMGVIGCMDFVYEIYWFDSNYYSACKSSWSSSGLDHRCVTLIGVVVVETFLSLGQLLTIRIYRFGQ